MATQTQTRSGFSEPATTTLDYLAIVLAVITGAIHLYEGVEHLGGESIAIWFILAGVGFFGGIALFWIGFRQKLLYLTGIVFTGIQIVAYFAINLSDVFFALGMVDKIVQLVLIGVLAIRYRQQS